VESGEWRVESREGACPAVQVIYYVSHEAPTLLIRISEREQLFALAKAAGQIWRGRIDEVPLESLFPVEYNGLGDLWLGRSPGEGCYRKSIYRVAAENGAVGLWWMPTADGWWQALGFLVGLLRGGPGHQYFGGDGADDAIIELSFRE
jgi:hypothetical protein